MKLPFITFSMMILISYSACNNDDCVTPEPIEVEIPSKYCDVENPLIDLPWLNEIYDSIQNLDSFNGLIISYELLNGEELIDVTNFDYGHIYKCSGEEYCDYSEPDSPQCDTITLSTNVRKMRILYPE